MVSELKPLVLGDLTIKVPIIQGGMGVAISTASLASAVANYGGAGTIASVGLGYLSELMKSDFVRASREGLAQELRKARSLTKGVIGVNILVAVSNYEDLVRTAVREKANFIISGAGLPLRLPEYAKDGASKTKLIPIVSSDRATDIIIKTWKKKYDYIPDAIIVEGPKAGGHLGFSFEELTAAKDNALEELVVEVIKVVRGYEKQFKANIPVIAAGGIYTGKDIAKFFKLGVGGVQIATRFVATNECSVPDDFKQKYINCRTEDIVIIKSPVGMPGRAIKTKLVERVVNGEKIPVSCHYRCLKTCDPKSVPYCIAKALINAVTSNIDEAVVFAGSNATRVDKIVTVKELMDEFISEAVTAMNK
ncbi:MAG: nitronate monooxygenase [Candidatus Omnitrophica bacterium]|nr:nitronate monooxygenase [Candidatus Omnitrophota bacterium]